MRFTIFTVDLDPETGFLGARHDVGQCRGPSAEDCKAALAPILRASFTLAFDLRCDDDATGDEPDLQMGYGTGYCRGVVRADEAAYHYRRHFAAGLVTQ